MRKKNAQNPPKIKKNLKNFLLEEEGRMVEKNALKLGIVLVAVSGLVSGIMKPHDVQATSAHSSHGSHGSHGSHASHGNGGGCSFGTW